MNCITLNNGVKMSHLGYGLYQIAKDECEEDERKMGLRV